MIFITKISLTGIIYCAAKIRRISVIRQELCRFTITDM